jgi:2-phospho-L-lactate guanylyltransferase
MSLHAIVPIKSLDRAKSRLAGTLTPHERRALVLEMLAGVVAALHHPDSPATAVWVVSADPTALGLAAAWGARPLREAAGELNGALEQARGAALASGAAALLVIPGDEPLVTPADIGAMEALLGDGADVALAPDAAGSGTNALGLRRGADLPFHFGHESALRHAAEAAARGLRLAYYRSPTLALDVDGPAGLARYRALAPARAARAVG